MNAAEITDKLGLHSLRQRAWVSTCQNLYLFWDLPTNAISSTFSPLVLRPVMVSTKGWSG